MDPVLRWSIAAMSGALGFGVMAAVFLADGLLDTQELAAGMGLWPILWFLSAALFGGFLGGAIAAPLFGRPDLPGWVLAGLGGVAMTALGGAIGGTFIVPGYGTVLGPIFALGALSDSAVLLAVWVVAVAGIHGYARRRIGP